MKQFYFKLFYLNRNIILNINLIKQFFHYIFIFTKKKKLPKMILKITKAKSIQKQKIKLKKTQLDGKSKTLMYSKNFFEF